MCILFCTVLYHWQLRRGEWFLHDLSGDGSQLSLPCMIRLEDPQRENLDSEICEGLRQQVGDVDDTSALMHLVGGAQASSVDLTPKY